MTGGGFGPGSGSSSVLVRPGELVARARALAPSLPGRAAEGAALRRLPDSTAADLRASGLYRVLQAARNGGFDTDLTTHLEVVASVAEGCVSTAWVVGVGQAHAWLVSHFPAEAQDEVYRDDPDALVAGVLGARGRAVPQADGGYRLTGRWPFTSGVTHADWALLGAAVEPGDGADRLLLVPVADLDVADDWHVTGLRATGSCTVSVDALSVPAHRVLSMADVAAGCSPGWELHDGPLHRSAMVPVLALALTGGAIGAGRAAIQVFVEQLDGKAATHGPGLQRDLPTVQRQLGEAIGLVRSGELLLQDVAGVIDDHARAGSEPTLQQRADIRLQCSLGVRRCLEAVELLYLATGGRGLAASNRLAELLHDAQAVNMHALLALEPTQVLAGRVALGLDPATPRI